LDKGDCGDNKTYVLDINLTIPLCVACFQVIPNCTYCSNSTYCDECVVGFHVNSSNGSCF
jgi:hypothetical protein